MSRASKDQVEPVKDDKLLGIMGAAKEGVLAIAPGLRDIFADVGAELTRLGVQGQMELASAIFGNGAFVPYGPGQYTPTPEHGLPEMADKQQQQGREMGGRSM